MDRQLLEGEGWRLGWNSKVVQYPALVGGRDWAIELNEQEFADFCDFVEKLSAAMEGMAENLMPGERVSCEMESDCLWMEAEGFPSRFSLRAIVRQGRACEGNWGEGAVEPLRSAIRQLRYQLFV